MVWVSGFGAPVCRDVQQLSALDAKNGTEGSHINNGNAFQLMRSVSDVVKWGQLSRWSVLRVKSSRSGQITTCTDKQHRSVAAEMGWIHR